MHDILRTSMALSDCSSSLCKGSYKNKSDSSHVGQDIQNMRNSCKGRAQQVIAADRHRTLHLRYSIESGLRGIEHCQRDVRKQAHAHMPLTRDDGWSLQSCAVVQSPRKLNAPLL